MTVKKKLFTFFPCKFQVDVPGPEDLEAEGDLLDCGYTCSRHGSVIATVSKRWFRGTDAYGIDIGAGEDDVLMLASAVVTDLVCHGGDDHWPPARVAAFLVPTTAAMLAVDLTRHDNR